MLKWLNDILLNGGKVVGIFLESVGGSGGIISYIVIGMGVNFVVVFDVGEVEVWVMWLVLFLFEIGVLVMFEEFLDVLVLVFVCWEV